MRQTGWHRTKALVAASLLSVALGGCTIPLVNVEVPIDLPDIKLPELDLSGLDLPTVTLPVGVQTSVEEARKEVLSDKTSTLSDEALVVPGCLSVGLKTASLSAPLCVEGEAGRVYGLDVDLAAALASEMGLQVRYVPVTDTSSLGSECDVVMSTRPGKPDKIAIAGTYVESATSFFHRGEPTVLTPLDLNGKSVGLQGGSASEGVLNGTGLKMSQRAYGSLNEAFDALEYGEVDYVLCEAYPGGYLASLHDGISFAGALEKPETTGVALLPANAELVGATQQAFETIAANGILELVRSRWVGSMPVLTTDSLIKDVPSAD